MFWMSSMSKHGYVSQHVNMGMENSKPKDPNTRKVLGNTIISAGIAGTLSKIHTANFNRNTYFKGFFGSFLALQTLQTFAQKQTTPLSIGILATAATAGMGFVLKDKMGAGTIFAGSFIASKLKRNPSTYGNIFKTVEGALEKVSKVHPLFKHLATTDGIKFVTLLTTLPVAHSLIRRAAIKISKMSHPDESPVAVSGLHSNAGHTKRHHEETGTSYTKNLKQQATVAVTGSVVSHINTGHILESFR